MTRKSAKKRAARALQDQLNDAPLLRCFNIMSRGVARIETPPTTIETLLEIVQRRSAEVLANEEHVNGPLGRVLVAADAADIFGAHIVATRWMHSQNLSEKEAWRRLVASAEERAARAQPAAFMGSMTVDELAEILRQTTTPDSVAEVTAAIARYSTPAPDGWIHVLAVAGGVSLGTRAPCVPTCWCGHPPTIHDESGRCTWEGEVPVSDGMRALARALMPADHGPLAPIETVWHRCVCAMPALFLPAGC